MTIHCYSICRSRKSSSRAAQHYTSEFAEHAYLYTRLFIKGVLMAQQVEAFALPEWIEINAGLIDKMHHGRTQFEGLGSAIN